MDRQALFGLVALGLAAGVFMRNTVSSDVREALENKNVKAFLVMIRDLESANDYSVLYGGSKFFDFSRHPNTRIPFHNPLRAGEGNNDYSTAAGAYQINFPTWLQIQAVAFLPDFSRRSQDLAAIWLLKIRGVLPDIIAGDFDTALKTASKTWASLPGSMAKQNPRSYQTAANIYIKNGGMIV